MNNITLKISNAICKSFKHLADDAADALLTLQVIILALYYAKYEDGILSAKFNIAEVHQLGLGIQYSDEQLEALVNTNGHLSSALEVKSEHETPLRLIKGAICYGTNILVYFEPELYNIVFPTDDYSMFRISDLFGYHSSGALSLYLLLISEQNMAYVHSGCPNTYHWDFNTICRILGLKYPIQRRPGRIFWDRFMDKTYPDIKSKNPGLRLHYDVSKAGPAHKLTSIDMQISGLEAEGIYGLSPVEVINDGIPWFSANLAAVTSELVKNNTTMHFKLDSIGRCTSAIALLTKDSIITTGNLRGVRSIAPLGYDKVKHLKGADDKYKVIKAHIIARRFSGPDAGENLIAGTASMNSEMSKIENSVAKYLQSEEGTAVLYCVEPLYDGDGVVPRKVRINALNLDQRDKNLKISVEILNAEPGISIDYRGGDAPAV